MTPSKCFNEKKETEPKEIYNPKFLEQTAGENFQKHDKQLNKEPVKKVIFPH